MNLDVGHADMQAGFSLIELVVVLGIVVTIAGMGLIMTMEEYRGYAFRSQRDVLVASLLRARSQSMNTICLGAGCVGGVPHGVEILNNRIIIFQGSDYLHRDTAVDEEILFSYLGGRISPPPPTEVVFESQNGDVLHDVNFVYQDDLRHSTISINTEGAVWWTH